MNRQGATLLAAALGITLALPAMARNGHGGQYAGYREQPVCRMVEETAWRDEVVAYRVNYHYQGRNYVTEMPYDPGPRLPVNVDVRPAW